MEDGFYWYMEEGRAPTVVKVENTLDGSDDNPGPWVYFSETRLSYSMEKHLEELSGTFSERLTPPEAA